MRNFDAGIAAEIVKENYHPFFLLELQLASGTLRINDADIPIYDGSGNLFSFRAFDFGEIKGSTTLAVESMDVEIDDTDKVVGAILLGEDVRNKVAILYFGVIDSSSVIHYQEILRGIIGGYELYDENKARVTITNEFILWSKKCLRPQSSSCPWEFKGTECAYAGAESWCDQSYDRCAALINTVHFGGERFMPSMVEKEIWWGRTRGA